MGVAKLKSMLIGGGTVFLHYIQMKKSKYFFFQMFVKVVRDVCEKWTI